MITRMLAVIGFITVGFAVLGAIDPNSNFLYCFGPKPACTLKEPTA